MLKRLIYKLTHSLHKPCNSILDLTALKPDFFLILDNEDEINSSLISDTFSHSSHIVKAIKSGFSHSLLLQATYAFILSILCTLFILISKFNALYTCKGALKPCSRRLSSILYADKGFL